MSSHVPLDALLPLAASPATRKSSKTSRARRADASPSATKTRALDANADVQAVVGKRKRAKDVKTAENERAVLAKTRTRKKSRDGQKKKISRRGDGERGDGERANATANERGARAKTKRVKTKSETKKKDKIEQNVESIGRGVETTSTSGKARERGGGERGERGGKPTRVSDGHDGRGAKKTSENNCGRDGRANREGRGGQDAGEGEGGDGAWDGFYEDDDDYDDGDDSEDDSEDESGDGEDESDDEDDEEDDEDDEDMDHEMDDDMDELRDAMDRDDPEAGLRALLRRLGNAAAASGAGGGLFRQSSSKLKEILRGLKQMDDPSAQMAALSELNEVLVISGEELMMSMPLDSFVPALIELMTMEYMPDIMLLAARALTTMADVMPPSRGAIVHHGALPQFCSRLLTIEYIDLAEQSLQALEKLSQDYGAECARQGALIACLSYLDFFSIGMQRVSLQTAANICRQLPSSALDGAMDAVPILANLLSHDDPRLVDCACTCLTNLAAKMAKDSETRIVRLCESGVVANVVNLIAPHSVRSVNPATHHSLIKLLNVCTVHNPDVAIELLRQGLPETLSVALSGCKVLTTMNTGPSSASPASSGLASPIVTSEQLLEVATLADALLPAVGPRMRSSPRSGNKREKDASLCEKNVPVLTKQEPELLVKYAKHLTNVLMQAVDSSVPQAVKVKCLSALTKWTQLSTDDSFKNVLETTSFAAFCSAQLSCKDAQRIQGCLDLVESGMGKKMVDMAKLLRKEGAVHALKKLSEEYERLSDVMDKSTSTKERARDTTKTPVGLVPALGGGSRGIAARAAAMTTDGPEYREALARARQVYEKFFVNAEQLADAEDPSVDRLRRASATLRMTGDATSVVEFLESVSNASTFELLESDAVTALREYLVPRDWKDKRALVRRYATFIKAAGRTKNTGAFASLIRHLSDALASCEDLSIAVTTIQPSFARRGRDSSGDDSNLAGLVRPFKVRFKRANQGAENFTDYSNNVVLVEPFATLSAIEDFLYPRVYKLRGAPAPPRRSSRLSPPPEMEHDDDEDDEDDDEDEEMSEDDEDAVLGDDGEADGRELDLTNEDIQQEDPQLEDDAQEPNRSDSFAARAAAANETNRLVFSVNGEELNSATTLLQAISTIARKEGMTMTETNWEKTNTIVYRAAKSSDIVPMPLQLGGVVDDSKDDATKMNETIAELGNSEYRAALGSLVPALCDRLKVAVANEDASPQFNDLLVVLSVLHEMSTSASRILLLDGDEPLVTARNVSLPEESFIHGKLTGKLARQLQDTLTLCGSATPTWCTALARVCPWLFPFELRHKLFKCVSFSLSRTLHHLHGNGSDSGAVTTDGGREIRIGRLQRQKVRVNRGQIFESAKKVFDIPNTLKMVLEVEFFEEVGTGTGPTLEFFTLLSKQFKRRKLNLWRDSGVANEDDLVVAPHGLFPAPITPPRLGGKTHASRLKNFKLLGQSIGKVLQDGRMLDLPLAPAFYRMLLGRSLGLHDLIEIDPGLGNTLRRLDAAANEIETMKREGRPESEWRNVTVDGVNIEDLCLTFVIPGASMELIKGGSEVGVNEVNLREYVDTIVDACVGSGVAAYFESVRTGLEQVVPLARLQMFNESELEAVICGQGEQWTPEMLTECITFDHGYNALSPPIKNFCDILSAFTPDQQRSFMRFVTGAPRLPPGGLASLQPRLTVVCKQPSSTVGLSSIDSAPVAAGTPLADGDLPSAMTCASYLKLPPYSCKEIMLERLTYAMSEGQGSFDLS
jgi:E3 ubiquitin-protein ligase TRIP12